METYRKKVTHVSEMTQQNSLNQAASCSCAHPAPSGDVMESGAISVPPTSPGQEAAQHRELCPFEVKASLSRSEAREWAAVALVPPVPAKPASIF